MKRSIDHLGIAVRSIETALGFYQDQLGLSVTARETVTQEKVHVAMLPLERLAHRAAGADRDGFAGGKISR